MRERFRLILEAQPSPYPAAIRLRRLLKYALRVCGFRNLGVEVVKDKPKVTDRA